MHDIHVHVAYTCMHDIHVHVAYTCVYEAVEHLRMHVHMYAGIFIYHMIHVRIRTYIVCIRMSVD
jgi:hypothetical protein